MVLLHVNPEMSRTGGAILKTKDDLVITLFAGPPDAPRYEEKLAFARALRDEQITRAQKVFDEFIKSKMEVPRNSSLDEAAAMANKWAGSLDEVIQENLDHSSIGYFVELVMEHRVSVAQALRASKRHAEHRAMKDEVFLWLDVNMRNFKSMDKAAEAIAGKLAPIAWRTARDWVGDWKKLRSAGRA